MPCWSSGMCKWWRVVANVDEALLANPAHLLLCGLLSNRSGTSSSSWLEGCGLQAGIFCHLSLLIFVSFSLRISVSLSFSLSHTHTIHQQIHDRRLWKCLHNNLLKTKQIKTTFRTWSATEYFFLTSKNCIA